MALAALALVVFGAYDSYPNAFCTPDIMSCCPLGGTQEAENGTLKTESVVTAPAAPTAGVWLREIKDTVLRNILRVTLTPSLTEPRRAMPRWSARLFCSLQRAAHTKSSILTSLLANMSARLTLHKFRIYFDRLNFVCFLSLRSGKQCE